MPFTFEQTNLPGVVLITPRVYSDNRGAFLEAYKRSEFIAAGIDVEFVQDNHSYSAKNVLRGMHCQVPPYAQAKLARVVRGTVLDVVVDLRPGAPTWGQWQGQELSRDNGKMVFVPEGFVHGFLVLSDHAEVEYKVSAEYAKEHEAGIIWNDPDIGIAWPVADPILSTRDQGWPRLADTSAMPRDLECVS